MTLNNEIDILSKRQIEVIEEIKSIVKNEFIVIK